MKLVNEALDVLSLALHSLGVHAVRSVLTSLGIIFGVCGVVAMLGFTEGASQQSQLYLRELGSDKIIIRTIKPPEETKASSSQGGANIYGLTDADVQRLRSNVPGVKRCVTLHEAKKFARAGGHSETVSVIATGPELLKVARVRQAEGRFLSAADSLMAPRTRGTCVLPESLALRLFGPISPLEQVLLVDDEPFTVVGTLKELPELIDEQVGGTDAVLLIPDAVRRSRLGEFTIIVDKGTWQFEKVEVSAIILQMADEQAVVEGAEVARSLLKRTHERGDYAVKVPMELLEQKQKQNRLWAIVLLVIAAISLVVGGIGIMNIMLASVTERTREIGIRRALGARRGDIAMQFLVEAVMLTTIGGLVGIAVGLAAQWGVNHAGFLPFKIIVTPWAVIVPFIMAVAVGLVSGFYPATRAARLDPIVALRHE